MGYTKTSDHPYLLHPPLLTPIHAHPPKMYSHLPPPTHKNCPPTLSYHKHPSPPTQKKCLPTTTNPKYTSAHLHLHGGGSITFSIQPHPPKVYFHPPPSTHKKCAKKYTFTDLDSPLLTHKKRLPTLTHSKYTFLQPYPPTRTQKKRSTHPPRT